MAQKKSQKTTKKTTKTTSQKETQKKSAYKSDFLNIMQERGFIHQCTDDSALDERLAAGPVNAYIGFDCTAPSLHVGSLIQIMVLRTLQKCGHKPIILIGGGTTQVGDPSGKDSSRQLLTVEEIERNAASIQSTLEQFVSFGDGKRDAVLVNNADWLSGLNYIEFLRDTAKHFSVNRMLTQDSVKLRLEREQNLSLLEFNYMVLQAYDFVQLNEKYSCQLQIGGSDQWGNIIMGIDLHRRKKAAASFNPLDLKDLASSSDAVLEVQPIINSKQPSDKNFSSEHFMKQMDGNGNDGLFGLTTPLLTNAAGEKMGKTASGAVWLHKDMLPAYDYWQYWRNVDDADVGRFLRLFTDLPLDEVKRLENLEGKEINEAKIVLATHAATLCHGAHLAKKAAETAAKVFEEGEADDNLPSFDLEKNELGKGIPVYELFRICELVKTGGESRRLIRGGGAKINDQKVMDETQIITINDFKNNSLKLTAGKKRHILIKLV